MMSTNAQYCLIFTALVTPDTVSG